MDQTTSSSPLQQRATAGSQQQPGSGHILESIETTRVQPSNSFSLPNTKTIELIGEEFVQRMKTEPEDASSEAAVTPRPSVVMSVSLANNQEENPPVHEPATEQQNLVYCNLNDLDFGGSGDNSSFALVSTTQMGETPTTSITTNANQQLLQMVQAVPGLQIASSDKNPYSAVSTILLQGGILQLKSDNSCNVSNLVSGGQNSEQVTQVLQIPVEQKISAAHEITKSAPERMIPTQQVVTSNVTSIQTNRPQDAIASILASMNTSGAEFAGDVVSVVPGLGEDRPEMVPLNLATSGHQVATIQQPQTVHVQGYKKLGQASQGGGGGVVTKKVIIATINGQQRILTPVSSPQLIAVKSPTGGATRLVAADSSAPLTIIQQKPVPVIQKTVVPVVNNSNPNTSPQSKSVDNKTCRWKFENGQICGKVFTKTYNLTVHMRMHQDIRPFPCTICEQTFRQKAHLQRHEATHGIDSTAGRKRRKKSLLEGLNEPSLLVSRRPGGRMSESEEEEGGGGGLHSFEGKRQKLSEGCLKTETDLDLDPMIEPIVGGTSESKKLCPVTVGTNTDIATEVRHEDLMDELEEDMEPVRYKAREGGALQVEQGVQYCEADLLPAPDNPVQSQISINQLMVPGGRQEVGEGEGEGEDVKSLKTEMVYASQDAAQQFVAESGEFIEQEQGAQLITADGSYIDASNNQLVMSDGALVSLVNCEAEEQQENVVNIVTSTGTNEQGQQIIIIDNLDQHSPELQREIMNALLADHNIVPISQ